MSKKMTPCEKLGYKVGDKFEVIEDSVYFKKGEIVSLRAADNSICPFFINEKVVRDGYRKGCAMYLSSVRKISKLKPAKQALADAVHQNGGWPKECHWMFAASNGFGSAFCWTNKPKRSGWNWLGGGKFTPCCEIGASIPNWHQCILSRDEYLTAYPEQVMVGVNNETEHKVEVEMKSESEVTIKIGDDWHKNGELPPVGEVCLYVVSDRCSAEVEITAHTKLGLCFVEIGKSGECYVSKTAELHRFRPIRTEREKAIDEMVCEFIDHYGNPKGGERYIGIASKLYDAGYRKEVKL